MHQINLDGQVISDFERDALHRETQRSQGMLQTRWAYDAAGRLSQQRVQRLPGLAGADTQAQEAPGYNLPLPGGAHTLAHIQQLLPQRHYQWDVAGQLTQIQDSSRGQRQYRYDALGRLTQALLDGKGIAGPAAGTAPPTSLQEHFAWDANSNPAAVAQNAESSASASTNTRSRMSLSGNRLRVWQDARYDYDEHGNLLRKTEGKRGSAKHRITLLHWDAEHQLIQAQVLQGQAAAQAEEREAAGQPLTSQDLSQAQTTEYAYDALGRRIAKRTRRPLQTDANATATNEQDAQDQTTWFAWDGDRMLVEQTGRNSTLTVYEPEGFVPIAQVHNGQLQHLHTDHLGTPQEASNMQGQMTWRVSYRAWGSALREEWEQGSESVARSAVVGWGGGGSGNGPGGGAGAGGAGGSSGSGGTNLPANRQAANESQFALYRCKLRFQGQYFDEETGLHYNRFRYYEPESGRFINQDPIGLLGGVNLFQYAPNPVGWIDPFGLAAEGQLGTYGSLTGRKHSGDGMEAHELVRHEALAQMGCTKKGKDGDDLRMRNNPSISMSNDRHDVAHANEVVLSQQHMGTNGKNQFQFGADGKPSKQQIDVWQGALRQSGMSASQARRLRKRSQGFLKSLCCCP